MAWSFNKELYKSVSSKTGPRVLIRVYKSKIITFYPKNSYGDLILKIQVECVFFELANKKNMKHLKFRKIEGFTWVLNNRVF